MKLRSPAEHDPAIHRLTHFDAQHDRFDTNIVEASRAERLRNITSRMAIPAMRVDAISIDVVGALDGESKPAAMP